MGKTATLNLRVDPEVKSSAEAVLDELGIPMATAVTIYLRQIARTGGIPFPLTVPLAPRSVDVDRMPDDELVALIEDRVVSARNTPGTPIDQVRSELLGS